MIDPSLNLTKLDILDTFPTLKIATSYRHRAPGSLPSEALPSFPADLATLADVEVEYTELPGWESPTTGIKNWYDLPKRAREYVEFVEKHVGVRVGWVGTGADREDMVVRAERAI